MFELSSNDLFIYILKVFLDFIEILHKCNNNKCCTLYDEC